MKMRTAFRFIISTSNNISTLNLQQICFQIATAFFAFFLSAKKMPLTRSNEPGWYIKYGAPCANRSPIGNLRWPSTIFLYLCVIHRYFQTTGSWAAKIGAQDTSSTKKDYIWICFIGLGTATMATQLVVNQHKIMGLIYFQKIYSLDFFHHLSLENAEKYWPIDTGLVRF